MRIWYRSRKSAENAIVYLITHPGHNAAKIGIIDADGSRLKKHSQRSWQILATLQVPGKLALSIEKEILDWWPGELALPFTSASRRCPTADRPGRSTPPRPT